MYKSFGIIMTLVIALVLAILPMPDWTNWLRPAWVLLVLIYWAMATPQYVSVGTAWVMGLLLDLLNGTVLGEHALALTCVVYFVSRMHLRLSMYPLIQQGFSILFFVLLYQFILYCVQGFVGDLPASHLFWMSSVTSMLLWPWMFVLLRDCRRWIKVA
jgi:rod shape-determining protein MreD